MYIYVYIYVFVYQVEWLKNQFTALRTPWEEGHIKLKIRRDSMLQVILSLVCSIISVAVIIFMCIFFT
jgi:hypothetical protein